ncbi:MAG: DUF2784 domain-containing protein [Gallionellaceae bacterium]
MYPFLADLILVLHALFITFVILGFVLVLIGMFRRWNWIKNLWFRLSHLLAIGIVVAESWFGGICPLTAWGSRLREAAGGVGYSESFIQHWLHRIMFYDFVPWVFTVAYEVFGILVLIAWMRVPPRFSRR